MRRKISFLGIIFGLLSATTLAQIIPIRNPNNNTYSYLDTINRIIINKYEYNQANGFVEGLARVNRNGLWGYIDLSGQEVIPCQFINANDFYNGMATVSIGIQESNQGFIQVKNEKYGVIDKTGKNIIPFEFASINTPFKNGLAKAQDLVAEKWGWINEKGIWKVRPLFDWVEGFDRNGISQVLVSGKYGYINSNGSTIIPIIFGYLESYDRDENMIIAGDDYRHKGFINKQGEIIIPFVYEEVNYFKNGLSKICKNGKWGCLNKSGRIQIPVKYNYISDFINDHAWVNDNGYWGVINNHGEIILPIIFDLIIEGIAPDRILLNKDGLWGLFDNSGKEIIPIKYEQIISIDSVTFRGLAKNYQYVYDIDGNLVSSSANNNWTDPYEKGLKDNWAGCSWEEIEEMPNLNQMTKSGGYKIDSNYGFYRIIRTGQKFGVEDYNSKIIVNAIYDSIKNINRNEYNYNENFGRFVFLACFRSNKIDLAFITRNYANSTYTIESEIFNTDYEIIHNYEASLRNRLIRVGKRGKFGLIKITNDKIQEITPLKFDDIGFCYADSLVFVKKLNLWGIWNIKLQAMSFAYQFENVKQVNGYAVCKQNKWALLNYNLRISTPYVYDNIRNFPCVDGLNYFLYDKKWGAINQDGDEILRPILNRVLISPNHGNSNNGKYIISKQVFGTSGYNDFDYPGYFIK